MNSIYGPQPIERSEQRLTSGYYTVTAFPYESDGSQRLTVLAKRDFRAYFVSRNSDNIAYCHSCVSEEGAYECAHIVAVTAHCEDRS